MSVARQSKEVVFQISEAVKNSRLMVKMPHGGCLKARKSPKCSMLSPVSTASEDANTGKMLHCLWRSCGKT